MKFYIPPQLTRLAIAFAIFITLFLLLRKLLIPDTFGQYGHYRGDSLIDNALPEIHYAGQEACLECHQDIEDMKKRMFIPTSAVKYVTDLDRNTF